MNNEEIKYKYYLYGKYLPDWITESNVDKALDEARSDERTKKYSLMDSVDYAKEIDDRIKETATQARSDTAKEIFKELDEIKCKGNHKGSATYDNDKYMDVIHVEDYEPLKKKYKVD